MSNSVLFECDDSGVVTVTLNRPQINNAFDDEMISGLQDAFMRANNMPQCRLLILSGAGENFCAGANLSWMKSMATYDFEQNLSDACALAEMLYQLYTLDKPTICLPKGAVFGGGVGLVAACDFAIAHPKTLFSLSEVKLGLTPATISPYVVEAMGTKRARQFMLTGERFGAEKAREAGLVMAISEQVDNELNDLITQLKLGASGAQRDIKKLIQYVANTPIDAQLGNKTAELIAKRRMEPEAQEGMQAFFAKRKPSWI